MRHTLLDCPCDDCARAAFEHRAAAIILSVLGTIGLLLLAWGAA